MSAAALPPSGPRTFLNATRRAAEIEALAGGKTVDVLVVGGGVTGAGVALDAVTRGLSVALLERGDLAMGTSRSSSKLAHGGLRYLAKLQFGVAWQAARERATLIDITAPHMVRALPQLTPVYGQVPPPSALLVASGIHIGDAMRALAGTSRRRLPEARRVSAAEARLWAPAAKAEGLRGAILSWDAQLEDDAGLVVALARTAAGHGASICTYCEVTALSGAGASVLDRHSGQPFEVRARHVVNATGAWAGSLVEGLRLRPSKGSHLLVKASLFDNPRAMLNVPVPGHFGRFVFALPREDGLVLIGLTDEPCGPEQLEQPLAVTSAEERLLLESVSRALERPLRRDDVVGRFAGVRPLLGEDADSTADLSRRHAVIEDPSTGAITVVGGKLTTYRRMAQDALDLLVTRHGLKAGPCRTRSLPLVGAGSSRQRPPSAIPRRLWRRFGTEAEELVALARDRPALLQPLAPGLPALSVEVIAAVSRQGALQADDVLDGRTRLGLVPAWRQAARDTVERMLEPLVAV